VFVFGQPAIELRGERSAAFGARVWRTAADIRPVELGQARSARPVVRQYWRVYRGQHVGREVAVYSNRPEHLLTIIRPVAMLALLLAT